MELNWNTIELKGNSEQELGMELVEYLKSQEDLRNFGGEKAGIYLVTSGAGARSSTELWANALENSPRFANPGIFPWTLANAPASLLARELNAQGPNYTIIGNRNTSESVVQNATIDFENKSCNKALILFYQLRNNNNLTLNCKWGLMQL